ncbi:Uncharacterized membrane protein YkvA, DUF1232 family [Hymenobacter psychrophilus]|uniref:Uncharacterized membrane protein YkvA, DUF1232 family n=1 Tax=Hymenobacter psychrophilus TaxID=651662 RepID=A0A1H3JSD6_9BACT|nr:Uncharacterized membrane protein YkvA, DUF1232 family [Hymenobacter psychrophilus]
MDKQNPKGQDIASSPLFKKFVGKAEDYVKRPTRMKQLLTDAYEKASQKNELGHLAQEAWATMQMLFRMIKSAAAGEYTGIPTSTMVAAVAVTIYFLSPIDLIPDFIPMLGLLDDVALVAWFSTTIKDEMDKFAEWENTRPTLVEDTDKQPSASPAMKTSSASDGSAKMDNMGSDANKPPVAPQATSTPSSATATQSDVAANTTDSSREPNLSGQDRPSGGNLGGNVR